MVRNIVLLGGNSHPHLTESVCNILCIPPGDRILGKFSGGESRCEIKDSVRGKDVYIIQSGSGCVNDNLIDLCIMISACKTGSAKRVTAVIPLFPYSRQPDWPYNKTGAPLSKSSDAHFAKDYTFESVPATPRPGVPRTNGLGIANGAHSLAEKLSKSVIAEDAPAESSLPKRSDTLSSVGSNGRPASSLTNFTTHDYENPSSISAFQPKPGYKQWVAQAGTLIADLLTCAGADHIITMDLHDPQYQGFFDVPVDNLYGKPLLQNYIMKHIPDYKEAVVVSPDAGGAKRATAIADDLDIEFALIHKERRPIKFTEQRNASMMLVGDIADRVCILVDDLADTANTITRAAKLLKREGATRVYALLTHGIFSGDAIPRLNASAIDKIIVTNSVPQEEHRRLCPKLEVLDIAPVFAEAIRRVHHGESISRLFQHG
ncbi:phosphoribosyl synthetase-associated domain-containing protein [Hirsutella rhossiliensis]|uniref:Phosphoribosyl synthetase-associated domain-containing protein n=1 Tax=Hirsutella rhossiliensis TaxID=111463 RepID=A0A9P8SFI0_9HYPO|nr:phosphoribosyl synthetase-associated domain-containing protein [Hirsutella rhossiliensis]KAH0960766.1 phosphoribosyl synthetase-associated domain-containing protein [Hirsutella rhossiliensis]